MTSLFSSNIVSTTNKASRRKWLIATVSVVALLSVLTPEILASDNTLTAQLDKVTTLTSGKIAKTGLIVGTICSAITGLFKNSWVIFISLIGIGLGLSYYLEYLKVWGTSAT